MKVELVVNGVVMTEFNGASEDAFRFQASIFQFMAEAQSEFITTANERSRNAFSMLNEMQFGISKTAPMDPHLMGPKA